MYYRRHELQFRVSIFFCASILSGAFSGVSSKFTLSSSPHTDIKPQLLAYAVGLMNGLANTAGWRWIFIIEGTATVVIAIISKFLIVDWPEQATFLNEFERKVLLSRLRVESGDAKMDRLDGAAKKRILTDPKVYLG